MGPYKGLVKRVNKAFLGRLLFDFLITATPLLAKEIFLWNDEKIKCLNAFG